MNPHDEHNSSDVGAASPGADELFAHGLLSVVHEATDQPREIRVRRVLEALHPGRRGGAAPRRRLARLLGAGTVCAAAVAALVFLISPVTPPTYASAFTESISVLRSPGDRRYTVTAALGPADQLENGPHATIDTRFPNQMLLRLTRPDGHEIIAGHDQAGEWAITPLGTVDRENPRRAWPGWSMQDGESLFADSIDTWLEAAAHSYSFGEVTSRPIPGREAQGDMEYRVGVRKPEPGALGTRLRSPDRIEVWINRETKVLERMEMLWKPQPPRREGEWPGREGPRPRPDVPPGNGFDMRPHPPFPPKGPPPEANDDSHVPPGPQGTPPDGGPERRDVRDGHVMPGDLGRPGDGRGPHGGPDGPRRPPLRRLIIERTDPPAFEDDWFSPQRHMRDVPGDAR
ncbi:MAG: hypothetical protein GIKADHBN_02121 [Phycisphaerales bacterium]|nr:hypothetical protein [Phycisphaerales bacterium]